VWGTCDEGEACWVGHALGICAAVNRELRAVLDMRSDLVYPGGRRPGAAGGSGETCGGPELDSCATGALSGQLHVGLVQRVDLVT
jgi:hypothetical protein